MREHRQLPHDLIGHAVVDRIQPIPIVTIRPLTQAQPIAPFVNGDLDDGPGFRRHELWHRAHVRHYGRRRDAEAFDDAVAERVIERRQELHVRVRHQRQDFGIWQAAVHRHAHITQRLEILGVPLAIRMISVDVTGVAHAGYDVEMQREFGLGYRTKGDDAAFAREVIAHEYQAQWRAVLTDRGLTLGKV